MKRVWIVAAIVLALGAGAFGIWWWNQQPGPPEMLSDFVPKASETPSENVAVQLFFVDDTGSLVASEAEVVASGDAASEAEAALQQLLRGPEDEELIPSVPEGVMLRGLYLDGKGTAYVDLAGVPTHLGGMRGEMLLAYGITDTLAYSFPADVRRVRLLLDGQEADTLGGHLAIDAPLLPRRDLINDEEN